MRVGREEKGRKRKSSRTDLHFKMIIERRVNTERVDGNKETNKRERDDFWKK